MPDRHHSPTALTSRHVERCEKLPADPPPGNYVVIDVMYFSTTVTELLDNGASCVHVTEERGDEFEFRADNPLARIGGATTPEYEPVEGYDFFNSPSYVQSVDVADRPVSMTSTNGGRTVTRLKQSGGTDVDVYVGTTTNAATLARHLRADDAPTYLVSAGTNGDCAIEDDLGAILIGRYLDGTSPSPVELSTYADVLETVRGPNYLEKSEVRRADVTEYVTAINSRSVVPKLVGDRFIDVAPVESSVSAGAQATS